MPAPSQPGETQGRKMQVALDPAQSVFADLFLLSKVDEFSGVDPWLERVASELPRERRELHYDLVHGLFYLLLPQQRYASFPAYIDDLAGQAPTTWGARLISAYDSLHAFHGQERKHSVEALLADFDLYLAFLRERFSEEHIDEAVERKAHLWLNDPERMQAEVTEHLRYMWEAHLEAGWTDSLVLLEDSTRAFREMEWPEGSVEDVARWVTGRELHEHYVGKLESAENVRFVPSAHIAPYFLDIPTDTTLWIVFGARIPEGAKVQSAALSRSEMLVRLNALADETRLSILDLLNGQEEMCAQEIVESLEISQSSASRHLRQLTATGYLLERRVESAKCYRLNRDQLAGTLEAVEKHFRLKEGMIESEPVAEPA